jgi:hypothetical protein
MAASTAGVVPVRRPMPPRMPRLPCPLPPPPCNLRRRRLAPDATRVPPARHRRSAFSPGSYSLGAGGATAICVVLSEVQLYETKPELPAPVAIGARVA